MTTLAERLQSDLTTAMKARDQLTTATLRMAIAAVKEAAVAGSEAKVLDDAEVEAVLRTQVKRRDEAAEAFRDGGRDAQADQELAEREVLAAYLPKGLDEAELAAIVDSALADGGFTEPSQMGLAMKAVMGAVAGRADGKVVSAMVKSRLVG
ncbi:GatB/YqeY domain-containing protein [Actinospongicola halichondriae]|uniref:GatB/YqeY domain-containing protein n=1 Tax=Actinospongicola halichondriae TaxID=3236844 RepID=UPI003D43CAE1